jgi:hypothetical protein
MRKSLALLLCVLLTAPACASAGGTRLQQNRPTATGTDPALLASYLKALPIGSRVRVTFTSGEQIRGTLMSVGDDAIVMQESTRLPEPPRRVALHEIRAVEPDRPGSTARTVVIAVAAGTGAVLGVLLLIAALAYD